MPADSSARDSANRSDAAFPAAAVDPGGRETLGGADHAAVLQINADDTVRHANTNMLRMLGADNLDALKGTSYRSLAPLPWAKPTIKRLVAKARTENRPQEITYPVVDPATELTVFWRIAAYPRKSGTVHLLIEDVTQFQRLRETFERFVSREVILRMVDLSERDFFTAARREITVLFADLRDFTSYSAGHDPARVQALLRDFFSMSIPLLKRSGGTIDKIIGDQVMALFGAPVESEVHAWNALCAARELVREHRALMRQWKRNGMANPLGMGVGIATGEAVVGPIGSAQFANYTAVGHTVNIAARLCAKAEAGEVLVTRAVAVASSAQRAFAAPAGAPTADADADAVANPGHPPRYKEIGPIDVKGLDEKVEVLSPVWDDD